MSLGRHMRVLKVEQPLSILLEHRSIANVLWIQDSFSVILGGSDGNKLKRNSSKLFDAYGCLGAINLSRGAEASNYHLLLVTGCRNVGRFLDSEIYRITDVSFVSLKNIALDPSSSSEFKRLLCSGSFYFVSPNNDGSKNTFDITRSLQNQANANEQGQFVWNRALLAYFALCGISDSSWFLHVMCGGIELRTIYVGAQQARAGIINRLSCERVGTRYNVRGVDDAGNVANFVESEQIICIGDNYSSFLQVRGSVPLYWEQPGLNVGSHKVKMPFGFDISLEAFEKHLLRMNEAYSNFVLVNLLGSKEGEASLSRAYQLHLDKSAFNAVQFIDFDYHSECRAGKFTNISKLMDQLNPHLQNFGVLQVTENVHQVQSGVLRVNCLDCLDRTNSVESYVGLQMVTKQLEALGYVDNPQLHNRFTEALKGAWTQTGDLISRMYAGTGALEGKDKVGKIKDGARSVSRAIQNNFLDQGKQETMDKLLRIPVNDVELAHLSRSLLDQDQYRTSSSTILRKMYERRNEFCNEQGLRICMGTWNVNGGKLFRSIAYKDKTLKDWLVTEDTNETGKKYYQALYDYISEEKSDLCLTTNDVVVVDYELEGGEWLHGVKGDEEGIFPAVYVQYLSNPYIVDHDFSAQEEGDLELWGDEMVDVVEVKDEWFTGKVYRDGECVEGIFPANFATKMDTVKANSASADIYAIGFEEMVELNAGNIVNASQANQQAWATELQKTLSEIGSYVLVTSEQLVGVCLFLFVRQDLAPYIREISVSTIKTGMGGAAGNKGAVAISMLLYNSSLCFVCSHFAAGQTQVQERNNDYAEISSRLFFAKGRGFFCHDYVFWCGDFNYRIDLTGDEVKELVKLENWEKMKENDQLLVQKNMGNVFKGFSEGDINFAPTYKYDLFSDDYDTSEKCRVPAWTDRVLWKRRKWFQDGDEVSETTQPDAAFNPGSLRYYSRVELKTSDHRPVVAVVDITIRVVDENRRQEVHSALTKRHLPTCCPVHVYAAEQAAADESLLQKFVATFGFGENAIKTCLKCSLLVVYPEPWMSDEAILFDGSVFEGKRMRVSVKNENITSDPCDMGALETVMRQQPSEDSRSLDDEIDQLQTNSRMTSLTSSYSSNNIQALRAPPPIPRPNSTPLIKSESDTQVRTKSDKKPPPRPPAITRNDVKAPPELPPPIKKEVPVVYLQPALVKSNPSFTGEPSEDNPAVDMSTWDLSSLEPPKIKPRKTVPKRRAPNPPKHETQHGSTSASQKRTSVSATRSSTELHAKSSPSPRVAPPLPSKPPVHYSSLNTGFLLDAAFSCDVAPSMPPPLVPTQRAGGKQSQNNEVAPPLIPTQSTSLPPPLFPTQNNGLASPILPAPSTSLPPPLFPTQSNGVAPPLIPTQSTSLPPPLFPTQSSGMNSSIFPSPLFPTQNSGVAQSLLSARNHGMAPPLVPTPNTSLPPPMFPTQTSGLAPPLIPTSNSNVAGMNDERKQQDPWRSSAVPQQANGQMSNSFTTNFSDFNFQ